MKNLFKNQLIYRKEGNRYRVSPRYPKEIEIIHIDKNDVDYDWLEFIICKNVRKVIITGKRISYDNTSKNVLHCLFLDAPEKLESIEMSLDEITELGDDCFKNYSSLVNFNNNDLSKTQIEMIGYKAFSDCSSLETFILPDGLKEIKLGTFLRCTNLKKITLPENLETIGRFAFYRCTSLEKITLPENIKNIGPYAFSECKNLKKIYFKCWDGPYISVIDNAFDNCPIEELEFDMKSLDMLDTKTFPSSLPSLKRVVVHFDWEEFLNSSKKYYKEILKQCILFSTNYKAIINFYIKDQIIYKEEFDNFIKELLKNLNLTMEDNIYAIYDDEKNSLSDDEEIIFDKIDYPEVFDIYQKIKTLANKIDKESRKKIYSELKKYNDKYLKRIKPKLTFDNYSLILTEPELDLVIELQQLYLELSLYQKELSEYQELLLYNKNEEEYFKKEDNQYNEILKKIREIKNIILDTSSRYQDNIEAKILRSYTDTIKCYEDRFKNLSFHQNPKLTLNNHDIEYLRLDLDEIFEEAKAFKLEYLSYLKLRYYTDYNEEELDIYGKKLKLLDFYFSIFKNDSNQKTYLELKQQIFKSIDSILYLEKLKPYEEFTECEKEKLNKLDNLEINLNYFSKYYPIYFFLETILTEKRLPIDNQSYSIFILEEYDKITAEIKRLNQEDSEKVREQIIIIINKYLERIRTQEEHEEIDIILKNILCDFQFLSLNVENYINSKKKYLNILSKKKEQ